MTVTYQVLNISDGGGSENLLINPRGKINQANESDGVLSAGQYFCDGWKAGAAGAEVYRDADGFRLISGSILQLVPNNLDAGRPIKGNLDVISGSPAIRINGGTDSESSNDQTNITFEVIGNNSKFTRLVLAESEDLPIYQQSANELKDCERFLFITPRHHIATIGGGYTTSPSRYAVLIEFVLPVDLKPWYAVSFAAENSETNDVSSLFAVVTRVAGKCILRNDNDVYVGHPDLYASAVFDGRL